MKRRLGVIVCFLLVMLLSGCEHGITLSGTVTVPLDVQQRFSTEQPGHLFLRADIPKTGVIEYTLGVLCEPDDRDVVVEFYHDGFGCAKKGIIDVWVEPGDLREGAVDCGMAVTRGISTSGDRPRIAGAQQIVFSHATGRFGCSSGTATVNMRLQLIDTIP